MSWWPPPRRSTAFCCGITTSSQDTPTPRPAWRAGTVSAVLKIFLNTIRLLSRPSGGGTPRRPPRRDRADGNAPAGFGDRGGRGGGHRCVSVARRTRRRREGGARSFVFRRPEISGRLQAFRLCQSERPEG